MTRALFGPAAPAGPWAPAGPCGPAEPAGPAGPATPADQRRQPVQQGRSRRRGRADRRRRARLAVRLASRCAGRALLALEAARQSEGDHARQNRAGHPHVVSPRSRLGALMRAVVCFAQSGRAALQVNAPKRCSHASKWKFGRPRQKALDVEQTKNYVLCSFREEIMFRAVVEEAAALTSLALFVGMIAVWVQVFAACECRGCVNECAFVASAFQSPCVSSPGTRRYRRSSYPSASGIRVFPHPRSRRGWHRNSGLPGLPCHDGGTVVAKLWKHRRNCSHRSVRGGRIDLTRRE